MMKKFAIAALLLTSLLGWAAMLTFPLVGVVNSTNNSTLYFSTWVNGTPLRYNFYYTPLTNTDTGTNWATTTNWIQFYDCNNSVTSAPMWMVPTNVWVSEIIMIPGGKYTLAALTNGAPYHYYGYPGLTITNQPLSP